MAVSPNYLIDELKKAAQQKLITTFLGTGIVGRTISQKFSQKKQSVEESLIEKALTEQNKVQHEINTTILKLEPLVSSIAKTVNVIANVWSKYVFTKQEELRKRREQLSKDKFATEEEESERKQAEQAFMKEPLYGTKLKSEAEGTKEKIQSSNNKFKSFVKIALLKMGAIVAPFALAAAVGLAGSYLVRGNDAEKDEDDDEEGRNNNDDNNNLSSEDNNERSLLRGTLTGPLNLTSDNDGPTSGPELDNDGPTSGPELMSSPGVSIGNTSTTDYMAAQEAGIAGIPATQLGSAPVSKRYEGPLFFQRNINAAAGDTSQTVSVGTVPPLNIPSYPLPVSFQPISSSTSLPPPPMSTTQGAMKVVTPNVSSVALQTNEVPYIAEKQIDAAAGKGPQTVSTQQPTLNNNTQLATPPNPDQSTSQPGQVYGENISPSPMSSTQNLDMIRNTMFEGPQTREAYLKVAQTGNILSAPGNIGGLSGLAPQNNESGSMLSSITTMINNLIRQASGNVQQVVEQNNQSQFDSIPEGPKSPMPSPIANRGSLEIDTTFEAHF